MLKANVRGIDDMFCDFYIVPKYGFKKVTIICYLKSFQRFAKSEYILSEAFFTLFIQWLIYLYFLNFDVCNKKNSSCMIGPILLVSS